MTICIISDFEQSTGILLFFLVEGWPGNYLPNFYTISCPVILHWSRPGETILMRDYCKCSQIDKCFLMRYGKAFFLELSFIFTSGVSHYFQGQYEKY